MAQICTRTVIQENIQPSVYTWIIDNIESKRMQQTYKFKRTGIKWKIGKEDKVVTNDSTTKRRFKHWIEGMISTQDRCVSFRRYATCMQYTKRERWYIGVCWQRRRPTARGGLGWSSEDNQNRRRDTARFECRSTRCDRKTIEKFRPIIESCND